ncbi:MAG: inorganic pyrophosphatase [Bacillota bacterium]|jgi:inorganic pyrophosphatase|nr:inorganic pyrophosphatase [Bacillota bacterium]
MRVNENVTAFIEVPRGSRNKYEYDHALKAIRLDRMLFTAVRYPADYGFIPETLAEDGDELDILVLVGEATFPGCLVEARPVAMLDMWDDKGHDEKIIAVSVGDPEWGLVTSSEDLPPNLIKEIAHFFAVYKELEGKRTEIGPWRSAEDAWKTIAEARERYVRQSWL